MQGGVCQRRGKEKLQERGVVVVKNTQEGCLMHSYSLGKCKGGGVCDSEKRSYIIGEGVS